MYIERNKSIMKKFETMINTMDINLANELISPDAKFTTPISPDPLVGGEGYLSVVKFMRSGFSNVKWEIEDMVTENNIVAINWTCMGTHDGEFLGIKPTGKTFNTRIMNFYYFDDNGKIINDIAAEGMIAIFKAIGACPLLV